MEILPLPESRAFWDIERENNSDSFMPTYMIMYIEKIKLFKIHRIYLLCGNSPDPGSAAIWLSMPTSPPCLWLCRMPPAPAEAV